jgi:hypothetical protein
MQACVYYACVGCVWRTSKARARHVACQRHDLLPAQVSSRLRAGDRNVHGVTALINLDGHLVLALQHLDGLTAATNDAAHDAPGDGQRRSVTHPMLRVQMANARGPHAWLVCATGEHACMHNVWEQAAGTPAARRLLMLPMCKHCMGADRPVVAPLGHRDQHGIYRDHNCCHDHC